jgi:2-deoxy-D-gluconate 3-dehydrogenase
MDLFDLTGRVALVTGGNGGIGLGLARGLAQAGATVAIVGRNAAKNAAAVAELSALGVPVEAFEADMATMQDGAPLVDAVVRRFGRVDVLVNNAGTSVRKPPQDYTLAEWRKVMDTNLTSAFLLSQACYPHFRTAGGGKIINIGSMMSLLGSPFAVAYGASKGGLLQMTKALCCAWAKDNIQTNAVLPGWIDTDLSRNSRREIAGLEERVVARTPAGRWGRPDDFLGIVVFLASPASDFVNGAGIPVDGGYSSFG